MDSLLTSLKRNGLSSIPRKFKPNQNRNLSKTLTSIAVGDEARPFLKHRVRIGEDIFICYIVMTHGILIGLWFKNMV
jgi:hypothetical protein